MRNKNLLYLLFFTLTGQLFFACNSAQHYQFAGSSQAYHSEKVRAIANPAEIKEISAENKLAEAQAQPENLTADAGLAAPMAAKPTVDLQEPVVKKTASAVAAETKNLTITKAQKKELKSALKQLKKQSVQNPQDVAKPTVNIVELIFAIILPPVGVLLHEDGLNSRFWISLLLTLLFFIPGMIYAILVVTDTI
ncbi:YqaE/Pmp3 family membrane protein [Adhaeribacter soli]|nr:YqaE/Pmp3 family membrane protein [Adhaeribacter soli]